MQSIVAPHFYGCHCKEWGGSSPHCQASEPFVRGMCLIKAQWMDGNFPAHFWQTSQSAQSHSHLLPRVGDIGHEYERVNEICIQRLVVTMTPLGTAKIVTGGNCHSKRSLMLYERSIGISKSVTVADCHSNSCHSNRQPMYSGQRLQEPRIVITSYIDSFSIPNWPLI